MAKGIKSVADVFLIIVWIYIVAKGLPFSGWLIAMSILFWFAYEIEDRIEGKNNE